MTIKIRKLQKKDLYNGFLLTLDALKKASDLKPKKAINIFEKISKNPNHIIYVAEENSQIVGTATILIEQKFIHEGGKIGHIEEVAVRKETQGKGIGQRVVRALLEYAEKQGCYKTILDCNDELIPFYEKIGFKVNGNCMRFDHLTKK